MRPIYEYAKNFMLYLITYYTQGLSWSITHKGEFWGDFPDADNYRIYYMNRFILVVILTILFFPQEMPALHSVHLSCSIYIIYYQQVL